MYPSYYTCILLIIPVSLLSTLFIVQHNVDFTGINIVFEEASNTCTPLGNNGSYPSSDSPQNKLQPAHDHNDTMGIQGSRHSSPTIPFNDYHRQPESLSLVSGTFSATIGLPVGNNKDLWLQDVIHLGDIRTTAEFIKLLQDSTLNNPSLGMSQEAVEQL